MIRNIQFNLNYIVRSDCKTKYDLQYTHRMAPHIPHIPHLAYVAMHSIVSNPTVLEGMDGEKKHSQTVEDIGDIENSNQVQDTRDVIKPQKKHHASPRSVPTRPRSLNVVDNTSLVEVNL